MKAAIFTLAVMVSLMMIAVTIWSIITKSWVPIQGFGIGMGICAVVAAIEIPLLGWAFKRWGE